MSQRHTEQFKYVFLTFFTEKLTESYLPEGKDASSKEKAKPDAKETNWKISDKMPINKGK